MSLFLTWSTLWDGGRVALPQVPRAAGDAGVELTLVARGEGAAACDPWPFGEGAVDLPVAARTVPGRRYASAGDLAAELSRADWDTLAVRLRPA